MYPPQYLDTVECPTKLLRSGIRYFNPSIKLKIILFPGAFFACNEQMNNKFLWHLLILLNNVTDVH